MFNSLLIVAATSSASLTLDAVKVSSASLGTTLPFITLFIPLINLAPPKPMKPPAADIPAILNASDNKSSSDKS